MEPQRGRTDKAHWLEALRHYWKTSGMLCQLHGPETAPSYCCLGVLAAEDGVLTLTGPGVRFLTPDVSDEGEVLGYVWQDPSAGEEVYLGHPTLTQEVQTILTRANDCTVTFQDVVIPLIEQLLADDLSLKPEHTLTGTDSAVLGAYLSQLDEVDRIGYFHRLVKALARGLPLMAAHAVARDQVESKMRMKGTTDG